MMNRHTVVAIGAFSAFIILALMSFSYSPELVAPTTTPCTPTPCTPTPCTPTPCTPTPATRLPSQTRVAAPIIDEVREWNDIFSSTDKTTRHGYHFFYGRHLPQYKGVKNLALLEIGARTMTSAIGWIKYFGGDTQVDMITYGGNGDTYKFKSECKEADEVCKKINVFYTDQSNSNRLEEIATTERPTGWDIIVDDGSHVPQHNIISFEALWKHVRPGGLYVVEDIETSYYVNNKVYGYKINAGINAPSPKNALSRFRQYADVLNRRYFGSQQSKYNLFEGDKDIMEIGYARNIIFIRKVFREVDSKGEDYHYYPRNAVSLGALGSTIVDAKEQFDEESKDLENWRTQ